MKLLVNAPSGKQELIEIEASGGYFDITRVIWDERIDGPLPPITLGGMVRVNGALVFNQARMDANIAASTPAVPQSVSRFQALAALTNAGLYTAALNAVTAAGGLTKLAWDNAISFERNSPTISSLATALGLTSAQLDALFIAASKITA